MRKTWNMNEGIILPPVALVNVTEGHTVTCPGFTLVGRPVTTNASSLVILHKSEVFTKNISVMNIHEYIIENMTWFKKNVAERGRKNFMEFMHLIDGISTYRTPTSNYMPTFGVVSSSWILFGLFAALFYYLFRLRRNHCSSNV